MRRILCIFLLTPVLAAAAQDYSEKLDSVVVSASRAGKDTPVTYSTVEKKALQETSPVNSIPMTLESLPSVVVSTEAGTGFGYSSMTIRGSKGSQINVTLNGITLNDAESQEVFWVNIPGLTGILSSVQVQRGLGTSASGTGAFGASINMSTASVSRDPHLDISLGAGSFYTGAVSASATSGLLPCGVYIDLGFTRDATEGYVRNGWVRSGSLYGAIGWLNDANSLKFTYLMGDQRSGITWTGTPAAYLETDRTFNPEGLLDDGSYYRDHSDNYNQQHFQLNYTRKFSSRLHWSTTLDATTGYGYNQRIKLRKKLTAYGFDSDFPDASAKGDVIFRKTMDNFQWTATSELNYSGARAVATGGVYVSRYRGDHYGEILWSEVLGESFDYASLNKPDQSNNWYFNRGVKTDINAFARGEYKFTRWLTGFLDLQYRGVLLDMSGRDDEDDLPMDGAYRWHFFNPRGGLTAAFGGHKVYASVAYGGREPGRADIKEVLESNNLEGGNREIRPEKMLDFEAGYSYSGKTVSAGLNIYMMEYRDMLLETGELSASGYAIKDNVPRSYRRGVEMYADWKPLDNLTLSGNLALSTNKILDYTQYYCEYDNTDWWTFLGQKSFHFDKVTMLMSPSIVGMASLQYTPFKHIARGSLRSTTLGAVFKGVGKQYWDNTQSADRCIPAYTHLDLTLSHEFKLREGAIGLSGIVKNVLGTKYYTSAWVYRAYFRDEDLWYQEEGVFPQPPQSFMLRLTYSF